jgi:hypothetical protein
LAYVSPVKALEWWEKVEYLTYSPRYFGPNAFPIPELVGGSLSSRWEVELRGEYHKTRGDQTKDIFTRLYIPVVKGRVGVNVSWVFQEWYEMSPEVRDERYAVELKSPIVCRGDVIFNFYFQALRSEKWMDIVVSANLKTAPGGGGTLVRRSLYGCGLLLVRRQSGTYVVEAERCKRFDPCTSFSGFLLLDDERCR